MGFIVPPDVLDAVAASSEARANLFRCFVSVEDGC